MTLAIPDVPDNLYQLLVNAANAVDTTNDLMKRSASHLNGMQNDTNKAVSNVLTTSHGLTTDTLGDIWTSSQVDFGVASDALSAYTSKNCMGGSPTPLRAAVEAGKTAIQNGVLAIERRSAFRRTATPQQLSFEDTVEGMMQGEYLERSSTGPELLDLLPVVAPAIEQFIVSVPGIDRTLLAQIVQWTMDIQDMESALSNIALALEIMLIGLNNLNNNGFTGGTCATGFVPGSPLPLFPTNAFLMKGSGSGGADPYQDLANKLKSSSAYTYIDIDEIVLWGEKQGLSVDQIEALFNGNFDPKVLIQLLKDGKINPSNINDVTTLLQKGVTSDVLTQLLNNGADLSDITKNVTLLQNGGVRTDLINNWLKNGTNLNNAVAIMRLGGDLNMIGTSSQVGNFTGLAGSSVNDVLARIPADAQISAWTPVPGGAVDGMKFQWTDASGNTWRVEIHGPDPGAPAGSNAASGWVLRVKRGSYYMDASGNWYKETIQNPRSPNYNPGAINATHIPIQAP